MVAAQTSKQKTKAKQHYLKAKRERRKKRKTSAVEALHKANVKDKLKSQNANVRDKAMKNRAALSSESDSSDKEPVTTVPTVVPTRPSPEKSVERPHKRRKVSEEIVVSQSPTSASSSSSSSRAPSLSEVDDKVSLVVEDLPSQNIPVNSLPTFDMPSVTIPGSQRTLALQGLDQGLIGAEIVDSSKTIPIDSLDSDTFGAISTKTKKRLKELGITDLFAVQTVLLPFLLPLLPFDRALYMPYNPPRDVCVSAPTGSGKTLAYVIPILELLAARIVTRLRALIVLPTRDLVVQVRETFEALSKGRGLKIGTATGQQSFAHEQAQLVDETKNFRRHSLKGGSSKIDILICTPGRLIDHLNGTHNFTLQHLRFLVIDEADRLLTQPFQDWLAQVLAAIRPPPSASSVDHFSAQNSDVFKQPSLPRHDAIAPAWQSYLPWRSHLDEPRQSSCQKLLFSATLTRDPAKIAALELRDAKYFIVSDSQQKDDGDGDYLVSGETFVFPATLSEHMIICSSYKKPLILFYLIHNHGVTNALVFTKSAESTNRLVRLFECFQDARASRTERPIVRAYSSELSPVERKSILEKFKAKEITILVCSDLISRGIDISHVSHVVSYDAPIDMRKYVHRVGRTARAGRTGDAWTLIEEQEARYFKKMLSDADHLNKVKKMRVGDDDLKAFNEHYEAAMKVFNGKGGNGDNNFSH
ncbi:DEAD-domain-containing protein [Hysterangium stoloniferum]|nr:DEAD-domain-containing protein [Hysterangium stoloniferum]